VLIEQNARAEFWDSIRFFFEKHSTVIEVEGTIESTIVTKDEMSERVVAIMDYYALWHRKPERHGNGLTSIGFNADTTGALATFLGRPLSVIEPIVCDIPEADSPLSAKAYLDWGGFWLGRGGSNILRQAGFYALWNLIACNGADVPAVSCAGGESSLAAYSNLSSEESETDESGVTVNKEGSAGPHQMEPATTLTEAIEPANSGPNETYLSQDEALALIQGAPRVGRFD